MAASQAPGEALPAEAPGSAEPDQFTQRSAASLLLLACIGLSLAILWATLRVPVDARVSFLTQNYVIEPSPLNWHVLAAGLAPTLLAFALVWVKRERALVVLESVGRVASPLLLAFALPALFSWQLGQQRPIAYLLLLAGYGLGLERLLRVSFGELGTLLRGPAELLKHGLPDLTWAAKLASVTTVVLAAAAYAAYMGFYTIRHHRNFGTTAFDLGIYDNMIFNAIKGHFFQAPVLYGPGKFNSLSGHAEYAVLLFAPFYAIKPGAETLLVIQAVCFGGAAIPLYMFARTFLGRLSSVLLALSYLLFAPLHGPQFYDFHWLPLCMPFYFFLFYAIARRKNWLSVLLILVLFSIREDIAIGLACLGAFLFITGTRVRFGAVLAVVSTIWFAINKFVIMPWAGSWWFENMYSELFADGKASYGNVIKTLISNPFFALSTFVRGPKLTYALHMLAPLVFLPLRRPAFLLLFLPGTFLTLMTTGYWPTISIAFQYTSNWIPFLFGSAVVSLWLIRQGAQGSVRVAAALGALCVVMLSHSYDFGAILQRESFTGGFGHINFEMSEPARKRYADMLSVVAKIPPNASVAATEYMSPHVSTRLTSYVFRYDVGPVDYIFLSDNEITGDVRRALTEKFKNETYGLRAKGKDEFFLFQRGYESPETADAYRHLGIHVEPKTKP
ncbi:MAG: DUF2079 domain-containing protein [Pseudomonadota bacterium]